MGHETPFRPPLNLKDGRSGSCFKVEFQVMTDKRTCL